MAVKPETMQKAAKASFFGAAFFALVAIGFFAFIFLYSPSTQNRTKILEAPNIPNQEEHTTMSENTKPPAGQADPNDSESAAKLRVLESLNQ